MLAFNCSGLLAPTRGAVTAGWASTQAMASWAMFWITAFAPRQFYVSVELKVRYHQMVADGEPYLLVARATDAALAERKAAQKAAAAAKTVKSDGEWSGDEFVKQSAALAR